MQKGRAYMDKNIGDLMKLDHAFENFIEKYVDSFVKWEIVQFFHDHPRSPFRQEYLAETLNRPLKTVKRELKELAERGLIREEKAGKTAAFIYDLPPKDALGKHLDQFTAFCQDREGRLRIIYKILKDGKAINN
jgi:hypothetical protein